MSELDSTSEVEYRLIPSFPCYFAGSDGSIWSRMIITGRKGGVCLADHPVRKMALRRNNKTGKYPHTKPYPRLGIRNATGKQMQKLAHDLVCEAFHGPCPPGMECRHLDGSADNNVPANLQWATKIVNQGDRKLHGTDSAGEKCGRAKLTNSQVLEMRELRKQGWFLKDIAAKYGVSQSCARDSTLGITWSHI